MTTYNARIYGHRGITRLNDSGSPTGGTDSAMVLTQPYLWAQSLTLTVGGSAVASTAANPANFVPPTSLDPTSVLHIEIPDGQVIGYEINEGARAIVASATSPRAAVSIDVQFGPNWTVSLIDMTGVS